MSNAYVSAIQSALRGFLDLLLKLAMPLAILLGLGLLALTLLYHFRKDSGDSSIGLLRLGMGRLLGFAAVGVAFVVCWAALSQTRLVVVEALRWKDAAENVSNPTEDAPPIYQFGPSAAILQERTFTRTISLPSDIGKRLQEEGVQVLGGHLSSYSDEGVLSQSDSLNQVGNAYTFTRNVRRMEETPVSFAKSSVDATFDSLGARAYRVKFSASYGFSNPTNSEARLRFTFPLPDVGTIDRLKVTVAGAEARPNEDGDYVWEGMVAPGESRQATVSYESLGSRTWHYDVGSRRRPVEQFELQVKAPQAVKFVRGSLQPVEAGATSVWRLSNVVTNQQVAIALPSAQEEREPFIQTMAMLPAGLAVFCAALAFVSWRTGRPYEWVRTATGILAFAFGLGSSAVWTNYLGSLAGVLAGMALAVAGSAAILGPRSLFASLPAALFVAAFLSPHHTGLIVAAVAILTAAAFLLSARITSAPAAAQRVD